VIYLPLNNPSCPVMSISATSCRPSPARTLQDHNPCIAEIENPRNKANLPSLHPQHCPLSSALPWSLHTPAPAHRWPRRTTRPNSGLVKPEQRKACHSRIWRAVPGLGHLDLSNYRKGRYRCGLGGCVCQSCAWTRQRDRDWERGEDRHGPRYCKLRAAHLALRISPSHHASFMACASPGVCCRSAAADDASKQDTPKQRLAGARGVCV